jgi:hypothetical protein
MSKHSSVDRRRERPDGRKSFLVYLPKDLIRSLKTAALNEERHAYEITEEAVRGYLAAQQHSAGKTGRRRMPQRSVNQIMKRVNDE